MRFCSNGPPVYLLYLWGPFSKFISHGYKITFSLFFSVISQLFILLNYWSYLISRTHITIPFISIRIYDYTLGVSPTEISVLVHSIIYNLFFSRCKSLFWWHFVAIDDIFRIWTQFPQKISNCKADIHWRKKPPQAVQHTKETGCLQKGQGSHRFRHDRRLQHPQGHP